MRNAGPAAVDRAKVAPNRSGTARYGYALTQPVWGRKVGSAYGGTASRRFYRFFARPVNRRLGWPETGKRDVSKSWIAERKERKAALSATRDAGVENFVKWPVSQTAYLQLDRDNVLLAVGSLSVVGGLGLLTAAWLGQIAIDAAVASTPTYHPPLSIEIMGWGHRRGRDRRAVLCALHLPFLLPRLAAPPLLTFWEKEQLKKKHRERQRCAPKGGKRLRRLTQSSRCGPIAGHRWAGVRSGARGCTAV